MYIPLPHDVDSLHLSHQVAFEFLIVVEEIETWTINIISIGPTKHSLDDTKKQQKLVSVSIHPFNLEKSYRINPT